MILLDTHALVWWVGGDPALSAAAARRIERARRDQTLRVSAISAWEVAQLVERERLVLTLPVSDWLGLVGQIAGLQWVAIGPEVAAASVSLPGGLHKDPADRFLVATARQLGATLITRDEKLRAYEHVKTLW